MPQREFFCPACKASLQKSDSMMALALMHESGGRFNGFPAVDHINCPGCGASIPVKDVASGKLDYRKGSLLDGLGGIALFGLIIFGVVKCTGG